MTPPSGASAALEGGADGEDAAALLDALRQLEESMGSRDKSTLDPLELIGADTLTELGVDASEPGSIVMYLQPIVRLSDRSIVGAESLVRWVHPSQDPPDTGKLLRMIAARGSLAGLGRWSVLAAIELLAKTEGERPLHLSVNVSSAQLLDHELFSAVMNHRKEIPSHRTLRLELTESALLDSAEMAERIATLAADNCEVILDNFGQGQSSLSHLRDLPVNGIKLGRQWVNGATSSMRGRAIMSSLAATTSLLGMSMSAVGVEDLETLGALLELGITEGQGFLFSPAVSADEFVAHLEKS